MKQPAFRLEPVLRLRRTQERAASLAAASAAREATQADRRADDQAAALAATTLPAHAPAAHFVAAMVATSVAAADVSAARALALAHAQQAEVVRQEWTAAAQRTKGLERLAERHAARLRSAADVAEARVVDDLVTRQHGETLRMKERRSREEQAWTG